MAKANNKAIASAMAAPFQPSLRGNYQTTLQFPIVKLRVDSKPADVLFAPATPPAATSTATPGAIEKENPFEKLPVEMVQEVARHIEGDEDLDNFRCSCKAVNNAVDDSRGYFWRRRFLSLWEKPRADSSVQKGADFKIACWRRNHALQRGAFFELGQSRRERECLEVVKDMFLDSYASMTEGNKSMYESINLEVLKAWVVDKDNDMLRHIFQPRFTYHQTAANTYEYNFGNPFLRTIQVLFAPLILDTSDKNPLINHNYSFPETQVVVYEPAVRRPIFTGFNKLDVDMDWALHQLNFWKYHMLREEECTLYTAYHSLEQGEEPSFHTTHLVNNMPLAIGKHWKGAYAFVDHNEIVRVRSGNNDEESVQDEFNSDEQTGDLQDMVFGLNEEGDTTWSPLFEEILDSLKEPTSTARTRAQRRSSPPETFFRKPRSFRFSGTGADAEEDFHADGWFNQLPPQNGVPGWQRMTMMKYYIDEFGHLDTDSLWAYEGVVIPGGKIIIGRWWSPTSLINGGEMYSGPFILWCVDNAHPESFVEEDVSTTPEASTVATS